LKEKLQEIGRKLLANADRTATAFLGVLFLVVIGLFMHELSKGEAEPETPPDNPFRDLLPNEKYDAIAKNFINVDPDIAKNEQLRRLTEFNMFDLKSVKAQEELAKQMDTQVDQAEKLIQEGKKDEALKILESVLARKADHVRALDLKNQILPPPTTTPTPAS